MPTISQVRDALKTTLQTISGLTVYDTAPGQVVVPAAVITIAPGPFLVYDTSNGTDDLMLSIRLIVSGADDRAGQDALDTYASSSGTQSIRAAIQADFTLGGLVHFADVSDARDYGALTVGTVEYFGCTFPVMVALA